MNSLLEVIINRYEIFLLIFIRVTGIFIVTPIFSRKSIPTTLKIVFCLFTSLILINVISIKDVNYQMFDYIIILIKELTIGLILGFISYLFFSLLFIAGQIIDVQIGFGMVNVLDPQHNTQLPIMGNFYYIFALLVFLTVNGHHVIIRAIVDSYEILPIGEYSLNNLMVDQIISVFGQTFVIALKVASPILATMFLINVFLGIMAKAMPQMNIFIVGMPFKIIIGLLVIITAFPLLLVLLEHIFNAMYDQILEFMKIMAKG
ncbi:flagellar biosynthetic protein FliR [Dethiothermospora halolimnae]|uniref:flagellar biosynthetic protein FliR n=1 Tax=Dethiothermospora halolimnae TaxID=3114390 RepID=UPI003CCBB5C7